MYFLISLASLFHYYIATPIADMHAAPASESKVVSQSYYSESIVLLEEGEKWSKIETPLDHYQGWVENHHLYRRDSPFLADSSEVYAKVSRCAAHLYTSPNISSARLMTLPFESRLKVVNPENKRKGRWIEVALVDERRGYIQRGDVTPRHTPLAAQEMCKLSRQFLNLPYTWGGRSSFGYNCSGFVQMLYRQMAVNLPRNSKDQACWEGLADVAIDKLQAGDLIFFGTPQRGVSHVALYLGGGKFIHATASEGKPYIHISDLKNLPWNGSSGFTLRKACRPK